MAETHRSLWIREAWDGEVAEPLRGPQRADVAIMGGGYVGLWTAIRIKEAEPDCEVAIIEADICGGGASGRNGGFVVSWWTKIASLIAICGQEEALRLGHAAEDAVLEVGRFCGAHGIDAHYTHAGMLWTATTAAQLGAWDGVMRICERLGVDAFEPLSSKEIARRAGSPQHLAGVFEREAATVQPALLARGLRRVARELGVRIYEQSPVLHFDRPYPPAVRTPEGALVAEKLVIATNAWAADIPELHNGLAVISSDIVATVPIPDRLREIGWTGGECITDSQMMIDYYRTTRDGRIAFGKGGWGIAYGAHIGPSFDRDAGRAAFVAADFRRVYPNLADVAIDQDWSGPIDRTHNGLPILGHLAGHQHIVYGVGWSGNGVGPSVLGGKILASLALGKDEEWRRSPFVDRRYGSFPPEPIRFLGAHVVREAVRRKEAAEAREEKPHPLATALSRLAPSGVEDRE